MLNYKIKDKSINTSQILVERINLPLNCEEKDNFFIIVILRSTKEKVSRKNSKQFLYLGKRKKKEEGKGGSPILY